MVEFLKDIQGDDFTYEKGKRYVALDDCKEEDLKDKVFIRQPNSPKKENWWTEFSRTAINDYFRICEDTELDIIERMEENRLLEL
jgi:hypothetical protein